MAWLPDGEKNSKISLFVLAELTNVTDRQTLHAGSSRAMHSITRQKPKCDIDELKQRLIDTLDCIPQGIIDEATDQWQT